MVPRDFVLNWLRWFVHTIRAVLDRAKPVGKPRVKEERHFFEFRFFFSFLIFAPAFLLQWFDRG